MCPRKSAQVAQLPRGRLPAGACRLCDGDQADGAGKGWRQLAASTSAEVRPVGHKVRNTVEHLYQACFELVFPAILGKPGRQAVQRREAPGIDLVRRVD